MKLALRITSDVLLSLALAAWVGGRAALGAFAARVVFRTLPRELAAPTMNRIFRDFDYVIAAALGVLALGLVLRFLAVRFATPIVWLCGGALLALGLFAVLYVNPQISALFTAGRSLDPSFQTLHRISERSAHLELLCSLGLFYGLARTRASAA